MRHIFQHIKSALDDLQRSKLHYFKALESLVDKLVECKIDSEIEKVWKMSEKIYIELGLFKTEDADAREKHFQHTIWVLNQLQSFIFESSVKREKLG